MARYDRNIDASAAQPLSAWQLHELLDQSAAGGCQRTDAVVCFLAGAEGWKQAAEQLGGAFADGEPGLSDEQSPGADR